MIIKVGMIGVIAVLIGILFKTVKPEYAIYVGMIAMLMICVVVLNYLGQVLDEFQVLEGYLESGGNYLKVLLKMVGITYICEFSSSICKDAGYQSISGQIDVFGKLCVIIAGLPIVQAVFELIGGFI